MYFNIVCLSVCLSVSVCIYADVSVVRHSTKLQAQTMAIRTASPDPSLSEQFKILKHLLRYLHKTYKNRKHRLIITFMNFHAKLHPLSRLYVQ